MPSRMPFIFLPRPNTLLCTLLSAMLLLLHGLPLQAQPPTPSTAQAVNKKHSAAHKHKGASKTRAPVPVPAPGTGKAIDPATLERFIDEMVTQQAFDRAMLQNLFRQVRQLPAVIDAMTPPAQAPMRSWRSYRAAFLNEARLSAGDQYLQRHREVLARARSQYGVPEEVIAAILGVETIYGRNTGNWRVIDALATMALGSANGMPPGSLPRAEFFRDELASFLVFARDQQLDALSVRGSYAGAFGIPQFMPGSWRRWGIDFDGDGRADLRASHADAIGSVANFLASHGWERDAPIAFDAQLQGEAWRTLIDGTVKPVQSLATLAAAGARIAPLGGEALPQPDPTLDPARLGILIELRSSDADPAYRIGLHNFWVITRYNRSSFYASAVLDFALALRARR